MGFHFAKNNYVVSRSHLFAFSCVPYVPEPEDRNLMKTSLSIYRKFDKWPDAMICAISLNDMDLIKDIFLDCKDRLVLFSFILLC